MIIFDTHTHDAFDAFDDDREEMIDRGRENDVVGKVQIGCDKKSSQNAVELALLNDEMWASVGVHPCHVLEESDRGFLPFLLEKYPQKIVAVGETGFDFFHNDTPELRKAQEETLLSHISLAQKYNKALVIHTRNAREETLQFFKTHQESLPKRGVFHCFSEDFEFARFATEELGYFLGIGGTLTYKKNDTLREVVKNIPLQYLVTETDAPYLAPQLHRGERNESAYLSEVVTLIADLKNIPLQKCSEKMVENAKHLFSLP